MDKVYVSAADIGFPKIPSIRSLRYKFGFGHGPSLDIRIDIKHGTWDGKCPHCFEDIDEQLIDPRDQLIIFIGADEVFIIDLTEPCRCSGCQKSFTGLVYSPKYGVMYALQCSF